MFIIAQLAPVASGTGSQPLWYYTGQVAKECGWMGGLYAQMQYKYSKALNFHVLVLV